MQALHDSTWLAFTMASEAAAEIWPSMQMFNRSFGSGVIVGTEPIPEILDLLPEDAQNIFRNGSWEKKEVRVKANIGGLQDDPAVEFLCVMGRTAGMSWQPLAIRVTPGNGGTVRTGIYREQVVRSRVLKMAPLMR